MVSDRPAGRRPADFTVVLNAYSPLSIAAIAPLSQSVVSGTNACLNVREAPKASSAKLGRLPDETAVTIAEVPTAADGPTWYRIEQIGRWHDAELPDARRRISPLRPHDLRHTFAFHLAQVTGADAYELERRLGHRSQQYIQRYTNPPEAVAASYIEEF
jgi:integrase-like protein/SH3 domain-containing protein